MRRPGARLKLAAGEELLTAHCPSHCNLHVCPFICVLTEHAKPWAQWEAVLRKPGALLLAQRRGRTQVPQALISVSACSHDS